MITQENEKAQAARQLIASEVSPSGENYAHFVNQDWVNDLICLYDSPDKCVNRDNAIIKKLGEVRDLKTAQELKFLLDRVDKKARDEFVTTFLNPNVLAEQSTMQVEVRWIGKTDKKRRNDGRARIYLIKDGMEEQVHFKRKPTFILYLILLLSIHQSEKEDTPDISTCEEQFRLFFKNVYAYDGGLTEFKTLMGEGNSKQKLLRHCLNDISHSIGDTCKSLHENASPYILRNKRSRLYILKKNVIIGEMCLKKLYNEDKTSTFL